MIILLIMLRQRNLTDLTKAFDESISKIKVFLSV